ncbi:hypothetical protein C5F59_038460 [Streptomyces sp. QL37]|uniref:helix-turn-helix transcriptional regulator n=1 Tax=Streptomyces sp. QL37 TaxID=2093747 RepID=UPI000CF1FBB1|nr:hypothetical protein [Streptomyces sp. QL37]PPQ61978.1 hypothetical protein C5F59_39000 [Streptomyces sp. QL37]
MQQTNATLQPGAPAPRRPGTGTRRPRAAVDLRPRAGGMADSPVLPAPSLVPGGRCLPAEASALIGEARSAAAFALPRPETAAELQRMEECWRPLRARAVLVRALYPSEVLGDEAALRHLEQVRALGVECRVLPVQQIFTAVIDQRAVYMAEDGIGRTFRGPGEVALLAEAFDRHWASAAPVAAVAVRLTVQHRTALQLMRSGMKDDKIARLMKISPRTLSRLIAVAMEELGAGSRFEVGAKAQELHLLS